MKNKTINRRNFLGSMGAATALGQVNFLKGTNKSLPTYNDDGQQRSYKAMICLFLYGGNDSYNMLMPLETDEYAKYKKTRGVMAIDQEELLGITSERQSADVNTAKAYGLHPRMEKVQGLYNRGKLSFLSNVGTLYKRFDQGNEKYDLEANPSKAPWELGSHSGQQFQWQTDSYRDQFTQSGWLGRIGDKMNEEFNNEALFSMNISTSKHKAFMSESTPLYTISKDGRSVPLHFYGDAQGPYGGIPEFTDALDEIYASANSRSAIMESTYAEIRQNALSSGTAFNERLDSISRTDKEKLDTIFFKSRGNLGIQLKSVIKIILATKNGEFKMERQNFLISRGGFDTHSNQKSRHNALLADLSETLDAFQNAIEEFGLEKDTMLYTQSDFGRTLVANSTGTDHGWGGHAIVMGGARPATGSVVSHDDLFFNHGEIYGNYPTNLDYETSQIFRPGDRRRGSVIPTTSVSEYMAELALWFGVKYDELENIIPNINNFNDWGGVSPLGMLA